MRAQYDMDYDIEWKYHMSVNQTQISPVSQTAGSKKVVAIEDETPNS